MRLYLVGLLLVSVSVTADASEETVPKSHAVDVLSFFVGACWEGRFSDEESKDKHCFTSMAGNFVRDRHEVSGPMGPYSGETIYHWDASTRQLEYSYWASNGGMSRGVLIPSDGGFVSPEETFTSASGVTQTFITRWRIDGPNQWTQYSETLKEQGSELKWEITYVRESLK